MTTPTLTELIMRGGGLEGVTKKQINAILEKLKTVAVVVEHRSLPQAEFCVPDNEPGIIFYRGDGGRNSTADFTDAYISERRSMTAVREAMAAHAVITSATGPQRERYDAAREMFLRQRLEAYAVTEGGAGALSHGAL